MPGTDQEPSAVKVMTLPQAAEYLQLPKKTLYDWRLRKIGPVSIKIGRHVRYRLVDIDRWLDEKAKAAS
jgi:excisionase family DNA binding protein